MSHIWFTLMGRCLVYILGPVWPMRHLRPLHGLYLSTDAAGVWLILSRKMRNAKGKLQNTAAQSNRNQNLTLILTLSPTLIEILTPFQFTGCTPHSTFYQCQWLRNRKPPRLTNINCCSILKKSDKTRRDTVCLHKGAIIFLLEITASRIVNLFHSIFTQSTKQTGCSENNCR